MPDRQATVDSLLPSSGLGYVARKSEATRYGTAFAINFIQRLGAAWNVDHPNGPRLQIGDISPRGGGPCPNGRRDAGGNPLHHKSHQGGIDFDVQIVRADGRELYRSVENTDPSTHVATQELVTLIERLGYGHIKFIFTAGTSVLTARGLRLERDHTYHLHVRLKM